MSNAVNPYESPGDASPEPLREYDWMAIWSWLGVFVANAVVPTFFGLGLIGKNDGVLGLVLGCLLMLSLGWLICLSRPKLIRTTITGACVLMLTQLFPIFQVIAGMISLTGAREVGLPIAGDDETLPKISGELAAFVVTVSTAAIHIAVAFAIGALIGVIFRINLNEKAAKPASVSSDPS
jgi:hypothetical protein